MFPFFRSILSKLTLWGSFYIAIGLVGFMFFFLLWESIPIFSREGLNFLVGIQWHPGEAYGALPLVYGTLMVTGIALCLALPLGLGTAIFTSEILPMQYRLLIKSIMELLAGIPGVVYGLLGIVFVTSGVKSLFHLQDGNTLFAAGFILGVMILPTIMTLSDDALRSVPKVFREQAFALGLNPAETILKVVIPNAWKGIVGGVLLGISRAMGETIAVMLVIGGIDRIPKPFYNIFSSAQSITSKLGREAAEAVGMGLHWNALMGLGLLLFLLVAVFTFLGNLAVAATAQKMVRGNK